MSSATRPIFPPSPSTLRSIFLPLVKGDHAGFWTHVAPDVQWTCMGTHPCAGTYKSAQEFQAGVIGRLMRFMEGVEISVGLCISGTGAGSDWDETTREKMGEGEEYWSVTELGMLGKCKNRMTYDNKYAWICRWKGDKIVQVREYLDSTMAKEAIEKNEALVE